MRDNKKNFKWLFVSIAALATVGLSNGMNQKVQADEVTNGTQQVTTVTQQKSNHNQEQVAASEDTTNSVKQSGTKEQEGVSDSNQSDVLGKEAVQTASDTSTTISGPQVSEQSKKVQVAKAAVENKQQINISDSDATKEAEELYGYLDNYTKSDKIMFGQQHATDEGESLTDQEKKPGNTDSDAKKLTGDNPAIVGWDAYLGIMGDEKPGVKGDEKASVANLAKSMNAVHDQGGIVVLSMHPDNFVTGGNYGDIKGDVVKNILPGGSANKKFTSWLDDVVDLSSQLKDKNGKQYAVIFRPFHEQTGSWFWWGSGTTSPEQYKAVYRYTVDYLRDHGVHNFLYGFTPGGDMTGDKDRYLKTYPGDDYVDVLGIDDYDTNGTPGSENWMNGLTKDIDMVVDLAQEKGKIPSLSEYGVHLKEKDNQCKDWYTKVLNHIENDPKAKKIAYMFTWANFGFPDNVYTPYEGFGDQAINDDFKKFATDSRIVMSKNVNFDKYVAEHPEFITGKHSITMTSMTPTDSQIIENSELPLNVRIDNGSSAKVIFSFGDQNVELTQNGKNWTGKLQIPKSMNNSAQNATITGYDKNGKALATETVQLFIKLAPEANDVGNIPANTTNIKTNGSWSQSGGVQVSLKDQKDGVAADFDKPFNESDSWQEVKFETVGTDPALLKNTNQMTIEGLVAADGGKLEAYGFDNTGNKTDYNSTAISVSALPTVKVNGKEYHKFSFKIKFPENINQKSIQFGLVGVNTKNFKQVILQKVELQNQPKEVDKNPYLVDDYTNYLGSNTLLDRAYATNGDRTSVDLITNSDGSQGMKYTYSIGANGYAGRGLSFSNPKNWQGAKGIALDLKNDSYPGDDFDLQTQMGGITFEGHVDLAKKHNGTIYVPFTAFAPAGWDTAHKGKTITDDLLKQVSTFYFYINSKVQGTRSVEISNVRAVKEPPKEPVEPTEPVQPTKPEIPTEPIQPIEPEIPTENPIDNNVSNPTLPNKSNISAGELKDIVLTHNAYLYDANGQAKLDQNGAHIVYKKGNTIQAWNNGKVTTIQNKPFYQVDKDGYIKVVNTLRPVRKFKTYKLRHNSFVYNHLGKIVKHNKKFTLLKKRTKIRAWNDGKVVKIKGKAFCQIAEDEFVKMANVAK